MGDASTADEQRKQAEAAIRIFGDVAGHMPIGVIVWRLQHLEDARTFTLVACNPTAERILGAPLTAHLGQAMTELYPGIAETPRLEQYAELVRRGGAREFAAVRGTSAAIADRSYRVKAFCLPDRSLATLFEDVTERRRADEALARLAAIVESSDDAIIGKSLDGVITSWNRGAERMFSFSAEQAVGQPTSLFIPESRRDEESRLIERIKRGEAVHHVETVRSRRDGSELEVSATLSPSR